MSLYESDLKSCAWNNNLVATISASGVTARNSSAIATGRYLVYTTAEIAFKRGTSSITAVAATSNRLPAGSIFWIEFTAAQGYLAVITDGGTGTVYIMDPGEAN